MDHELCKKVAGFVDGVNLHLLLGRFSTIECFGNLIFNFEKCIGISSLIFFK